MPSVQIYINPFYSKYRQTGTLAESKDPDEMLHMAAFQSFICL